MTKEFMKINVERRFFSMINMGISEHEALNRLLNWAKQPGIKKDLPAVIHNFVNQMSTDPAQKR